MMLICNESHLEATFQLRQSFLLFFSLTTKSINAMKQHEAFFHVGKPIPIPTSDKFVVSFAQHVGLANLYHKANVNALTKENHSS